MSERIQVVQLGDKPLADGQQAGPEARAQAQGDLPASIPPGQVGAGRKIRLHFALTLENGAIIEDNFARAPVSCVVGDGNLMPGFEAVLLGLQAGAELDQVLEAQAAFGEVNEDNIQRFPCYQFPPDLEISKGLVVDFTDRSGYTQAGVVLDHDVRYVTIDFNHPLAGRKIRFRVKLYEVE